MKKDDVFMFLVIVAFAFLGGMLNGSIIMNDSWKAKLAEQGLYEYRVDSKTGEKTFVPVEKGE